MLLVRGNVQPLSEMIAAFNYVNNSQNNCKRNKHLEKFIFSW